MNKVLFVVAAILAGTGLFVGGFFFNQVTAQSNQPGWMMGNGNNQATSGMMGNDQFGPGMMGDGQYSGMMGMMMNDGMMSGQYGSGMMGSFGGLTDVEPLSIVEAETAVTNYLTTLNNDNLTLGEIVIFNNHAYAQIIDATSGTGAFEVLVDPVTQNVFPEPGPNMMWNTEYGMMSGGNFGMMGGMMNGQYGSGMMGMMPETMDNMDHDLMSTMPGMDDDHMAPISSTGVPEATETTGGQPLAFREEDGVKVFELVARPVRWTILEDGGERAGVTAWAYNGTVPGPLIRVTEGDAVRIILQNELPEPTSIHWHGIPLPNAMDGVPPLTQAAIEPGDSFVYEFIAPPAGSFMYHSHVDTDKQIMVGLYAPFIVDPWYRAPAPEGLTDLSAYPRSFLKADEAISGWHTFGTEWVSMTI